MRYDFKCKPETKAFVEAKADSAVEGFRGKTPDELRQYLTNGLKTQQGQNEIIERLTKCVYYLLKRIERQDKRG